jgi:DNA-binding MarR family transcriptional regulator
MGRPRKTRGRSAEGSSRERSLEACACFNVRTAARAITDLYDLTLAPAGLRTNQFAILAALHREPGASMQTVAHLLGLDPSTMTRVLRPLEDSGWVAARADEGRRAKQVQLTALGRQKLRDGHARWREAQDRLRDVLGEDVFTRVVSDLRAIPEALQRVRRGGRRAAPSPGVHGVVAGRSGQRIERSVGRVPERSRRA